MPTAVELTGGKLLPVEVLATLQRLANVFGGDLRVLEADHEWVRFYVVGVPDATLIRQLDQMQAQILPGCEEKFQFLCPTFPDGKRGVYLHHLSTPALRQEYRAGAWFY